jgi:hypothetical protein
MARTRSSRAAARPTSRADGDLRRRHRSAARRMGCARTSRHRPRLARCVRAPRLHQGAAQVHQNRSQCPRCAAPGDRACRTRATADRTYIRAAVSSDARRRLPRPPQLPHPRLEPAQVAVGIEPLRRIYDLRHTFATFALRAGISTFELSRYMGASLTMIDRHYGHLARDRREHSIRLLDTLNATAVDVRGRSVDAQTGPRHPPGQPKRRLSRR